MTQVEGFGDKVGFIWSIADLLRGDYRPHEYGQVILPLTVLRRLDCALGAGDGLPPSTGAGRGARKDPEKVRLSEIAAARNSRFGLDRGEAHRRIRNGDAGCVKRW